MNQLFFSYLIIGLTFITILVIAAICLDVKVDNEYRGNFYLACAASTPEQIAEYLEIYLEDTKDFHGYTSVIYKNPSTDIDEQRKVVQSFLDRATSLAEEKSFDSQRLDVQMGLGTLKRDMTYDDLTNSNDLQLVRWHMLHWFGGLLAYMGFFVMAIWWWTLMVWAILKEIIWY